MNNLHLAIGLSSAALLIILSGFIIIAYLMFIGKCIVPFSGFRKPKPKNQISDIEHGSKVADDQSSVAVARRFGWVEVESLTGGFTAEIAGEGGFSTVYIGRLSGSKTLAVKVQRSSERLRRAFLQELDVLLRIDHPNIVRLVGYCNDRDEGVLVFEYVPNGTLFDNLHGGRQGRGTLTWAQRMRIAYGVASAVAHLHGGSGALQIVHGDLTSSNVLLDSEMKPLLCDFGSAAVGFSAAVVPAGGGGRGQLLLGSPGYADPLLMRTGVVSKKTDIYSFGVLLLELITGSPAFIEEEERFLTAAVGPVVRDVVGNREKVRGIVDIKLRGRELDEKELMTMAELAGRCIGDRPGMRPSMAEILVIMRETISAVDIGSDSC